jgi:MFS family permease
LSVLFVKETLAHVEHEGRLTINASNHQSLSFKEIFFKTSWRDKNLFSCSQAGLVNNINDGMAWGVFPIFFASIGFSLERIGFLIALYPAVWGIAQLGAGMLSDWVGRKWMIAVGMWVQAAGLWMMVVEPHVEVQIAAAILLGLGTAMVYPTLLAAVGDAAHPAWRATAVGVYRMWRDFGYAIGALLSGIIADIVGVPQAILAIAALTFVSGMIVAIRYREPC